MSSKYITKGKLYKFIDTMRHDDEVHIVIALETEDILSWKSEIHDYDVYDLVAVLKNDILAYAWVLDLIEVI